MGFTPPGHWTEVASQLRTAQSVTLDANGKGTCSFSTDHANQRWVISAIVVSTNQPSQSTVVPYATGALNTNTISEMSPSNQFGTTWDGNNDTFSGDIDLHSVDFFSVMFYPPPGQSGSALAGVIATAVVMGTKYTRRA